MTHGLAALADAVTAVDGGLATRMAAAALRGPDAVRELGYQWPSLHPLIAAVSAVTAAGVPAERVAGLIEGAAAGAQAARRRQQVALVWSGPQSAAQTGRLTRESLLDVIRGATESLLVIGYAVHDDTAIRPALEAAIGRGVEVTLLLERSDDNASFSGAPTAFDGIGARRLSWPARHRPDQRANLHAKVLVADKRTAVIGSANLTAWAFERNLECGVVVSGDQARRVHEHIEQLVIDKVLVAV